jgi:ArsR family transcriptional regulator, arsenate/arsenite/antimonite-responsive transcriptional repressor
MKDFIRVMKALSDPSRVKVIKMLQQRQMCVCEIRFALGLAQPTISKHLKVLEDAGLVQSKKDGLWVNYSLSGAGGSTYAAKLLENLENWFQDEPDVARLVKMLPVIRREEICRK